MFRHFVRFVSIVVLVANVFIVNAVVEFIGHLIGVVRIFVAAFGLALSFKTRLKSFKFLFFLRFFRQSKDRLFGFFSLSFLLLAANAVAATMLDASDERRSFIYVVRLFAFLLIIYAIWDKNRAASRG